MPTAGSLPSRVLRTGKAELIPEVSDGLLKNIAQNGEHLQMLRELGVGVADRRAAAGARASRSGRSCSRTAESSRRFDPEDLELAEDLARRAALAIDNATLHESEQEARRRAERAAERIGRLQAVTAALSGAVTPAAVAEVLVEQGAAAVGADGGFVRLLTPDGRQLELVAAVGISEALCALVRESAIDEPAAGRRGLSHRHGALFRVGRRRPGGIAGVRTRARGNRTRSDRVRPAPSARTGRSA